MDMVLVLEIVAVIAITILATWGSKAWVKYYKSKQKRNNL